MKTPPKTKSAAKPAKAAAKPAAKKKTSAKPAVKGKAPAKHKLGAAKPKPKLAKPAARTPAKAATKAGPKARAPKPAAAPQDPSEVLTKLALAALEDLKGLDIKVLDVRDLTTIADNMVICTGTSNRHVKSLAENVMEKARDKGHRPLGVEGLNEGEWVLVNLNGVLVHVMQAQARLHYQLEKLWDMGSGASAAA